MEVVSSSSPPCSDAAEPSNARPKRPRELMSSDSPSKREDSNADKKKKSCLQSSFSEQVAFPLIPALNSRFFFGTSLSFVNREAAEHTRNLARYANKIKRFLHKHSPPKAYYYFHEPNDADTVTLYQHEPATSDGPTAIAEHSLDVFMVAILEAGVNEVDFSTRNRSLEALQQEISKWWDHVGKNRVATRNPDNYLLP